MHAKGNIGWEMTCCLQPGTYMIMLAMHTYCEVKGLDSAQNMVFKTILWKANTKTVKFDVYLFHQGTSILDWFAAFNICFNTKTVKSFDIVIILLF